MLAYVVSLAKAQNIPRAVERTYGCFFVLILFTFYLFIFARALLALSSGFIYGSTRGTVRGARDGPRLQGQRPTLRAISPAPYGVLFHSGSPPLAARGVISRNPVHYRNLLSPRFPELQAKGGRG